MLGKHADLRRSRQDERGIGNESKKGLQVVLAKLQPLHRAGGRHGRCSDSSYRSTHGVVLDHAILRRYCYVTGLSLMPPRERPASCARNPSRIRSPGSLGTTEY